MRRPRLVTLLCAAALAVTAAGALQPAGAAAADPATSEITLFLKAPDPGALTRLATARSMPRAARLAELSRLIPSAATHEAVARSLRLNGYRVVDQTSWSITAVGARRTSAALFGTRPTSTAAGAQARFRAAIGPLPRVPGSLAGAVTAVFPTTGGPKAFRHRTGPLDGTAFRNAYAPPHITPSTGQHDGPATVATLQLANFYGLVPGQFSNSTQAKDLSTYASRHGITDPVNGADKRYTAVKIFNGPNANDDAGGGDIEVELDQESILSTAPSAHQQAYFAPNTNAGYNQAFAQAYDDVVGNQYAKHTNPNIVAFSTSWGGCESETGRRAIDSLEPILQSLTAAGVTIFSASGDAGIYDCSASATPDVDYPGSSPYVVSVGGTHLRAAANQPNTGRNWTETGWSCGSADDCQFGNGGGGGGQSGMAYSPKSSDAFSGFAAPVYQRAAITNQPFRNNRKRLVPDIAGNATLASGFRIWTGDTTNAGDCFCNNPVIGGTSLASPVQAALLTNALADSGRTVGVGDIHGALYSAYSDTHALANTNSIKAVRDITVGRNGASRDRGGDPSVNAQPGFDTVSGVGAVYWPAVLRYVYDRRTPVVRSVQFTEPHPHSAAWRTITAHWQVARGRDLRLLGATHVVVRRLGGRTIADFYGYPPSGSHSFVGVPGATYQISVQARDIGRHQSAPSTARVRVPLDDTRFTHGTHWQRSAGSGDVAGSHLNGFARGMVASASGFGTSYGLRAHVGPSAGRVGIGYRGHRVATLDLHAARPGIRTFDFFTSTARAARTFSFTDLTNRWVGLDALIVRY